MRRNFNKLGNIPAFPVLIVVALALSLVFQPQPAASAGPAQTLDVSITLRETRGVDRSGELVTVGLPVASSLDIRDSGTLGVIGPDGTVIPSQAKVTGRWGGPPEDLSKPVRWVLVDFLACVPANSRTSYRITNTVQNQTAAIAVSESAETISVDTGPSQFGVSKATFKLLDSVVAAQKELLERSDPRNGLAIKTVDGTELIASGKAQLLKTEITEQGPVKVVIHQRVQFEDPLLVDNRAGDYSQVYTSGVPWLYDDSEAQRSRLRISLWTTFVRSSSAVRIRARVENVNTCLIGHGGGAECGQVSSLNSVRFEDLTLHLGLADPPETFTAGSASGAAVDDIVVYQDSSGQDSWDYYRTLEGTWKRYARDVSFRGYRTSAGGTLMEAGNHAAGWLAFRSGQSTFAVGIADPWKHFPVAMRGGSGGAALEAGLYPKEFSRDHTLRAGDRKTHEVSLFLGSDPDGTAARATHAWVESPLVWSWPPQYALETRALPGFSLAGLEPDYEVWNSTTIEVGVSQAHNQYSWWQPSSTLQNRDLYGLYGKDVYGYLINDNEQETSTDLSKYNQYRGFLRQALRNAEADEAYADTWRQLGIEANKAQADAGYLVQPYAVQESIWTGLNFAHCYHEYSMDVDFPRGSGFGCDFSGDLGGLIELYYLIGYEPSLDAAMAHLDNTYNRSAEEFITSYQLEDREFGSRIEILLQGWQLTGNRKYLDQAIRLSNLVGAGTSTYYLDCPCPTEPADSTFVGPLFLGWLLRSLGWLADELTAIGEAETPAYAHISRTLGDHANWYANKVMIHDTTNDLWVLPYHWYTNDTTGANNNPAYTAYALMAADGLALAYTHTGNPAHLATAAKLFRSTMAVPFSGPGWQFGTYATINEAGKYAEFGGTYITAAHAETPPVNTPPVAAFALAPLKGPAPLTVTADASGSYDPDGGIVAYQWQWGDGTPDTVTASATASHTYLEGPATRSITLTVTDDRGATAASSAQVAVEPPKTVQSVRGTVKIKSTKGSGYATVQFNIARAKNKQGYQGFITIRDDGARFLGQATLNPGDPVSPVGSNGATGVAAGTAVSGGKYGRISLKWQASDLSSIGQGADWISLSATGDVTYTNSGAVASGDLSVK